MKAATGLFQVQLLGLSNPFVRGATYLTGPSIVAALSISIRSEGMTWLYRLNCNNSQNCIES